MVDGVVPFYLTNCYIVDNSKISFIACVVFVSVVQVGFMVRIRLRCGIIHDSELRLTVMVPGKFTVMARFV